MAQSDLAAAISGRIRATGPSRASAVRRDDTYGARRDDPYGQGYPRSQPDDGYQRSRPEPAPAARRAPYPAPDATPPGRAVVPVRDPLSQYREAVSARAEARVTPPVVETIDAEVVSESRPGSVRAHTASTYAAPTQPASGYAERDLGARLRESQAYAATGGAPQPSAAEPTSWTPRRGMIEDAEIVSPSEARAVGFVPANETESELLAATVTNNTDAFLSTLLLARVILPVPISMPPGSRPRDKYFPWQIEEVDGERLIAVFTSPERLADYGTARFGPDISTMSMRFIELIEAWPSERVQFSINPATPVGTTLPGSQIVALASWAAEVGLRRETPGEVTISARKHEAGPSMGVAGAPTVGAATAITMQRTVPPEQVSFYLDRGYDRVSGFVNRASEVAHLKSPRVLYRALGLIYPGSAFAENDAEVHVLRWVAHRPDLYRLPYGGQSEAAMRAMQGWVIERAPFRGNGFAPGETDVVAEFKVDSVRLPHGAQMWRLDRDGTETLVASFDADAGRWVRSP
jgi:hypothetical protein